MKKVFKLFAIMLATVSMFSCNRIDAGHEGIKVKLYGSDKGVSDVELVTGMVWYNPLTTRVYEYPTFVQTIDYPEFTVNSKDGSQFTVDPNIQLNIASGKAPEVFKKYRLDADDILEHTMYTFIYNAYRIELNKFTADELMSNRETFETAVEQRLRSSLLSENIIVGECTSGLVPPESLVAAINAKNKAVQDKLKVQNEVEVAKAEAAKLVVTAEAEKKANELRNISLTPQILESMWIEKWDGKLPVYGEVPRLFRDISK